MPVTVASGPARCSIACAKVMWRRLMYASDGKRRVGGIPFDCPPDFQLPPFGQSHAREHTTEFREQHVANRAPGAEPLGVLCQFRSSGWGLSGPISTTASGKPRVAAMFAVTRATSRCQLLCQHATGISRQRAMSQDGVTVTSMTGIIATNSAKLAWRAILARRNRCMIA